MMKQLSTLILLLLACSFAVHAQTEHQNTGWFMFVNSTKISKKWATQLDLQYRTSDDWTDKKNLMFRPGLTYLISNKHELTLGYLLNESYTYPEAAAEYQLTEHRIWEQYIFKHKVKTVAATHRFRLEQRFIERYNADELFSQRFRYFLRFLIPLKKEAETFEKGVFVALQNEVFLNLLNKQELNDSLFDQNRAYGALGYRVSKKFDAEVGYMNQAVKGSVRNTSNNIIQLALYTRF
jgi:hypothetical protein